MPGAGEHQEQCTKISMDDASNRGEGGSLDPFAIRRGTHAHAPNQSRADDTSHGHKSLHWLEPTDLGKDITLSAPPTVQQCMAVTLRHSLVPSEDGSMDCRRGRVRGVDGY